MAEYAKNTTVPVERSRAEIERILQRYNAASFAYGWDRGTAIIGFTAMGRQVKFTLPLPDRDDKQFTHYQRRGSSYWHARTASASQARWEQACRQRWRALALAIKAKLEAVESEISTFEDEFLAFIILPDGTTAGDWMRPQIADAYENGRMPPMLPALEPGHG